jgi:hypothetical protein
MCPIYLQYTVWSYVLYHSFVPVMSNYVSGPVKNMQVRPNILGNSQETVIYP